jgi:hypothetical protein
MLRGLVVGFVVGRTVRLAMLVVRGCFPMCFAIFTVRRCIAVRFTVTAAVNRRRLVEARLRQVVDRREHVELTERVVVAPGVTCL